MTVSSHPSETDTPSLRLREDPWALPLTIGMGALVVASKLVPSASLGEEGFTALRALFCASCLLVMARRFRLLLPSEAWIVCNFALLYNPIVPFSLYDRQLWVWVNLITVIVLARLLYRTERPNDRWGTGLIGFLIGVYLSSLVADDLLADMSASHARELVALPVSLAIGSFVLYFVGGWAVALIMGVGELLEHWGVIPSKFWKAKNDRS
jgi:hypothetical protein